MAPVSNPVYLIRRNHIFYFRIMVPKKLLAVFAKREYKKSLHTSDYKAACRLSQKYTLFVEQYFSYVQPFRRTQKQAIQAYKRYLAQEKYSTAQKLKGFFGIPTGVGKTAIFIGIVAMAHKVAEKNGHKLRTAIVVPTTQLLGQTKDAFEGMEATETKKAVVGLGYRKGQVTMQLIRETIDAHKAANNGANPSNTLTPIEVGPLAGTGATFDSLNGNLKQGTNGLKDDPEWEKWTQEVKARGKTPSLAQYLITLGYAGEQVTLTMQNIKESMDAYSHTFTTLAPCSF